MLEISAGLGDDPGDVGETDGVPSLQREEKGRTYPGVTLQVGALLDANRGSAAAIEVRVQRRPKTGAYAFHEMEFSG